MQLAVVLPSFGRDPARPRRAAAEAESVGLDGAFCYDHLWPLGHPGKPAMSAYPLLGAIAADRRALVLGTLVSRIGLEPDDVLADKLETLGELAPAGFIAGLGTGDEASEDENTAFGLDRTPASTRRASLARVAERLVGRGVEVMVGGGSPATNALGRGPGRSLNLWDVPPAEIAARRDEGPVSWGGPLPDDEGAAAMLCAALAEAGASWAIFSWPGAAGRVVTAARRAGLPGR